jgi:hypothetical protein
MKLKFLGAGAALALGCMALTIASAGADVIYTYTGNDFATAVNNNPPPPPQYTMMDSVSGSFTLPTALGDNLPLTTINPTSFSFTDGVQTITNTTNGVVPVISVATTLTGSISEWDINIQDITSASTGDIESYDIPSGAMDYATNHAAINPSANYAQNTSAPGSWTTTPIAPAPTPVMGTGGPGLVAGGLAFLFWRARPAAKALVRRQRRLFAPVGS